MAEFTDTYEDMLRDHDRDIYKGNGKPGITTRLNDLERWQSKADEDLYGKKGTEDTGLVREYRDDKSQHEGRMKLLALAGGIGAVLALGDLAISLYQKIHVLLH